MSRPILVQFVSYLGWQFIRCNLELVLDISAERGGSDCDLRVQQRQSVPAISPICSFGRRVVLSHDATSRPRTRPWKVRGKSRT